MIQEEDKKFISIKEASELCFYSQEYLSLRARQGKLKAKKLGRNWSTTIEWLEEYISKTEEYRERIGNKNINMEVEKKNHTRQVKEGNDIKGKFKCFSKEEKSSKKSIKPPLFLEKINFLFFRVGVLGIILFFCVLVISNIYAGMLGESLTDAMKNEFLLTKINYENEDFKTKNFSANILGFFKSIYEFSVKPFKKKSISSNNKNQESGIDDSKVNLLESNIKKDIEERFSEFRDKIEVSSTEEGGVVVMPVTGDDEKNKEIMEKIRNNFSDEIVVYPDDLAKTGVIKPVFKSGVSEEEYLYMMVPVDEEKTQKSIEIENAEDG